MILLDTHVLLWWLNRDKKLPAAVSRLIGENNALHDLAISTISIWEIVLLVRKKRLILAEDVETWVERLERMPSLQQIAPTGRIMMHSASLPEPFHADPADRIIVATAIENKAMLITKDDKILGYPHVRTYWKS